MKKEMLHTFVRRGKKVLIVILLFPIVFLIFTNQQLLKNVHYTVMSQTYEEMYENEDEAVEKKGTPYYRIGSYWDKNDKSYHCPGGGGGTAKSCSESQEGGGFGFLNQPITPTPNPGPSGSVKGYALSTTNKASLTNCASVALLKSCVDDPSTSGCEAFQSKQYLLGTQFWVGTIGGFLQADETGVEFNGVPSGISWTVVTLDPQGAYTPYLHCWKKQDDTTYSEGNVIMVEEGKTTTYLAGYTPILPWIAIYGGGNSYANILRSNMPLLSYPDLLYDNTQSPTKPGILSIKDYAGLSDQEFMNGYGNISQTNWNTDHAHTSTNWYTFFTQRLSDASRISYPPDGTSAGAKPPMTTGSSYTVYATPTAGDLTVSQAWQVGSGGAEKLIMVVDGNLTIDAPITVASGSFLAFIVKGNITIGSTVGTTWDSTTPQVEGVYIAGGTLKTGTSEAGRERFVGKGIFAAANVTLQRDLLSVGHNKDAAADLFLYNPELLITMPDPLKDFSYVWQEVAP